MTCTTPTTRRLLRKLKRLSEESRKFRCDLDDVMIFPAGYAFLDARGQPVANHDARAIFDLDLDLDLDLDRELNHPYRCNSQRKTNMPALSRWGRKRPR